MRVRLSNYVYKSEKTIFLNNEEIEEFGKITSFKGYDAIKNIYQEGKLHITHKL